MGTGHSIKEPPRFPLLKPLTPCYTALYSHTALQEFLPGRLQEMDLAARIPHKVLKIPTLFYPFSPLSLFNALREGRQSILDYFRSEVQRNEVTSPKVKQGSGRTRALMSPELVTIIPRPLLARWVSRDVPGPRLPGSDHLLELFQILVAEATLYTDVPAAPKAPSSSLILGIGNKSQSYYYYYYQSYPPLLPPGGHNTSRLPGDVLGSTGSAATSPYSLPSAGTGLWRRHQPYSQ